MSETEQTIRNLGRATGDLRLLSDEPVAHVHLVEPNTFLKGRPLRTIGIHTAQLIREYLKLYDDNQEDRLLVEVRGAQTAAECRRPTPAEPALFEKWETAHVYHDYWNKHEHVFAALQTDHGLHYKVCRHCLNPEHYGKHV